MFSGRWPIFVDLLHPGYLALLAVLPLVVLLSLRSLAGLGPVRRVLAISLRCLVMAVMVFALAGPQWGRTTDDQTVVFALDESSSIPSARAQEAETFMQRAAEHLRAGKDRVAVLRFAGRSSVEQLAQPRLAVERLAGARDRFQTDVARALRLGLALFPVDTAKRLVLLSDGNENSGLAAQEADTYAALGIPIDVVPLRYEHEAEILVDQLSAPAAAKLDEAIDLHLVVRAQEDTSARLLLYRDDELVDLDPHSRSAGVAVELTVGANRFSIPLELHTLGVHRFEVAVQPDDPRADGSVLNNTGRAFTLVGESEHVTLVTDCTGPAQGVDAASADMLAGALRAGGIECQVISAADLPADPVALVDCSALILSNVSAFSLGEARQEMLASYVRDQGGGLIVVGGDHSFCVGGYAHTPLEEVLPVETSRRKLRLLSLSLVLVIDRSGSMDGEKIVMARQAALGSVELLTHLDQVGVVAFSSMPEWVVPLQRAADRAAIARRISRIGSAGGTQMYPALRQAVAALLRTDTNLKHIIVLTDGQSAPGDFEALARAGGQAGITISTIAVGPGADRGLLTKIAELSGGRMYVAESARPLPQIFARETVLAGRSGLYERPFTPSFQGGGDDRLMVGFRATEFPRLRGHVISNAKPRAHVSLARPTADGMDPILAYWQVGLGRAVAFTSGLWPKWGPEWGEWPGFSKLWTQAVHYVARPGNPGDLEVETTVRGGEAHVSVSAEHLALQAQGSLTVTGQMIAPDFSIKPLALRPTSVGRFEATFPLDTPGTYVLSMPYSYSSGGDVYRGVLRTGAVMSYSPEHRALRHDESALARLAQRTGGRILNLEYPEAVFEAASIHPVQVRRPIWDKLIQWAMALFLLDVAVRRLALTPAEAAARMRQFIYELAGARPGAQSVATLGALREVKARMKAEGEPGLDVQTPTSPPQAACGGEDSGVRQHEFQTPAADRPQAAEALRSHEASSTSKSEYTERLLRAKRRARGRDDQGHNA